jgi:hypothetical protein
VISLINGELNICDLKKQETDDANFFICAYDMPFLNILTLLEMIWKLFAFAGNSERF